MKVAAHPLVVAVALGLIAPDALEAQAPAESSAPCANCPDGHVSEWNPAEVPSAEELHRVEIEWLRATSSSD